MKKGKAVTIRTNRWYLRVWFWTIERVVYCVYIIVCYLANTGQRQDWKKYMSTLNGRKRFQIDLGFLLMEFGICHNWKDIADPKKKPAWMRQLLPSYPCNCNMCFFCKEGMTDGIYHGHGSKRRNMKRKQYTNETRKKRV